MKKQQFSGSNDGTRTDNSDGDGDQHCPAGFLTRPMLLQRTGLTLTELKSLQGQGLIKATKRNNRGWYLWSESDIVTFMGGKAPQPIPSTESGNDRVAYSNVDGAQVFNLLKAETPLTDIVVQTQLHPSVVRTIVKDYDALAGTISLSKQAVDRMNQLPLDCALPLRTEEDVFTALESIVTSATCGRCRRRPKSYCTACTSEMLAKRTALKGSEEESGDEDDESAPRMRPRGLARATPDGSNANPVGLKRQG